MPEALFWQLGPELPRTREPPVPWSRNPLERNESRAQRKLSVHAQLKSGKSCLCISWGETAGMENTLTQVLLHIGAAYFQVDPAMFLPPLHSCRVDSVICPRSDCETIVVIDICSFYIVTHVDVFRGLAQSQL